MITPIEEAKSEIRNACVSITGILKYVDKGDKTLVSAWFEMVSSVEKIRDALVVIKDNLTEEIP